MATDQFSDEGVQAKDVVHALNVGPQVDPQLRALRVLGHPGVVQQLRPRRL